MSSRESAAIGGAAHLVNFQGSDTVAGIRHAQRWYGAAGGMPGFSIPAAEHSTIIAWGRAGERDAYANLLARFALPGKTVACVSDSYDLFHAVERLWGGELLERVRRSGATVVVRPDSGEPRAVVLRTLRLLAERVGTAVNRKGYRVLPPCFRILQGDGVTHDAIDAILTDVEAAGFSASNLAFGMGGALLQQLDRDTLKFAYKCCAVRIGGAWRGVRKQPATDAGKGSKAGRLDLRRLPDGTLATVDLDAGPPPGETLLRTVYDAGRFAPFDTLDAIRARAEAPLRTGFPA